MSDSKSKKCVPCISTEAPLKGKSLKALYIQMGSEWKMIEEHHLERVYQFHDFKQALAFTNIIGKIAEEQDHHPNILLTFSKIKISIWTHKIDGLSEADFLLADKIEAEYISHQRL
jgi:4a-hydroxytetrahydrobiopterin dehydratase